MHRCALTYAQTFPPQETYHSETCHLTICLIWYQFWRSSPVLTPDAHFYLNHPLQHRWTITTTSRFYLHVSLINNYWLFRSYCPHCHHCGSGGSGSGWIGVRSIIRIDHRLQFESQLWIKQPFIHPFTYNTVSNARLCYSVHVASYKSLL